MSSRKQAVHTWRISSYIRAAICFRSDMLLLNRRMVSCPKVGTLRNLLEG